VKVKVGVRCMDYFCKFLFNVFVPFRISAARYRSRLNHTSIIFSPGLVCIKHRQYFHANRRWIHELAICFRGKCIVRVKILQLQLYIKPSWLKLCLLAFWAKIRDRSSTISHTTTNVLSTRNILSECTRKIYLYFKIDFFCPLTF